MVDESETGDADSPADGGPAGILGARGGGGSVGSRGSRRLTGASVGFALAPLDEVESMRVEVVSPFFLCLNTLYVRLQLSPHGCGKG